MIRIINNAGLILELDANQVITIEKHNTLLNEADVLFQDRVIEFNAPYTPANDVFCNLAYLVEAGIDSYSQPVTLQAEDQAIEAGTLGIRTGDAGYILSLAANLAAAKYIIENVKVTAIRTHDRVTITESLDDHMLNTCKYPERYPYIFVPVKNQGMVTGGTGVVNFFDFDEQVFKTYTPRPDVLPLHANIGFFKVVYILKNIAEFMGFRCVGSFFTDPYYDRFVIFSQLAATGGDAIYTSMRYMSYMQVSDWLKEIRRKTHIAPFFNMATKELTVETFRTITASPDVFDLSPYIISNVQQEVPEANGYTITLVSDETDNCYAHTVGEDTTYPARKKLIAGNGETPVTINCGTLTNCDDSDGLPVGVKWTKVDQKMINPDWQRIPWSDLQVADDEASQNTWPLRIFRYLGFREITPGKFFPESETIELNEDNVQFYRFLNDSKKLTITARFPPVILAGLKLNQKFAFQTEDENYIELLIEKLVYDAGPDTDLITTKIYARSLNYRQRTEVNIQDVDFSEVDEVPGMFKAYFDPEIHGFKELNVELIDTTPGATRMYSVAPIKVPTNEFGIGGLAARVTATGDRNDIVSMEVRIRQGEPKYYDYLGKKYNFIFNGEYYYAPFDPGNENMADWRWIKF